MRFIELAATLVGKKETKIKNKYKKDLKQNPVYIHNSDVVAMNISREKNISMTLCSIQNTSSWLFLGFSMFLKCS